MGIPQAAGPELWVKEGYQDGQDQHGIRCWKINNLLKFLHLISIYKRIFQQIKLGGESDVSERGRLFVFANAAAFVAAL